MMEFRSQCTYQFKKKLGVGGLGEASLYLRKTQGLPDSEVVIKTLRANDSELLSELINEGEILASLTHPNIVRNFGYEITNEGKIGLLLEYVSGVTLFDLLKGLDLSDRHLVAPYLLKVIVSTISDVHENGVIHGDISSNNILVSNGGRIKISDFGLSRGESQLTDHTPNRGKKFYLAPERAGDGGPATGATDIFALGVLAFEILSGCYSIAGLELCELGLWAQYQGWEGFFQGALEGNPLLRSSAQKLVELIPSPTISDHEAKNLLIEQIKNAKMAVQPLSDIVHTKFLDNQVAKTFWNSLVATISFIFLISTPLSNEQSGKPPQRKKITTVVFTSEQFGKITINGRPAGFTPYSSVRLPSGKYRLQWTPTKGRRLQREIKVLPRPTQLISLRIPRKQASKLK